MEPTTTTIALLCIYAANFVLSYLRSFLKSGEINEQLTLSTESTHYLAKLREVILKVLRGNEFDKSVVQKLVEYISAVALLSSRIRISHELNSIAADQYPGHRWAEDDQMSYRWRFGGGLEEIRRVFYYDPEIAFIVSELVADREDERRDFFLSLKKETEERINNEKRLHSLLLEERGMQRLGDEISVAEKQSHNQEIAEVKRSLQEDYQRIGNNKYHHPVRALLPEYREMDYRDMDYPHAALLYKDVNHAVSEARVKVDTLAESIAAAGIDKELLADLAKWLKLLMSTFGDDLWKKRERILYTLQRGKLPKANDVSAALNLALPSEKAIQLAAREMEQVVQIRYNQWVRTTLSKLAKSENAVNNNGAINAILRQEVVNQEVVEDRPDTQR